VNIGARQGDVAIWELGALFATGVATAVLNAYVKPSFGIPGSSIVWTVVPIALGLVLVPRRGAGSMMGVTSLMSMFALHQIGTGAMASMLMTGIFLDLALRRASQGIRLYAAFAIAGLAGNACAFVSRVIGKLTGIDAGTSPLATWWSHAIVSYALCGLLAGVLSATLWFQLSPKKN
jgi:hypothetical protein